MDSNIAVRIDRITISGKLPKWSFQEIESRFEFSLNDDGSFQLIRENDDGTAENMAWLGESQFQRDTWRLDFNPANINAIERDKIQRVVKQFKGAHFTRLDVAFDIFNDPFAMRHRVYRTNVKEDQIETFRGRNKSVETVYWGVRKSEQQIRLYDKLVEQKKRHKPIPDGVKSWARLELQLRGKKPTEWVESAMKMLSQFKLPALQTISDPRERAIMSALETGVIQWRDLSVNTRTKYRRYEKNNVGYDTELATRLLKLLDDQKDTLNDELHGYLVQFIK